MKRILIIEDDANIARAMKVRLQANGYDALIAEDAIKGCTAAVAHRPDLIFLDLTLPGGNGLSLAKQFHDLPETAGIPIIFVTASKDPNLYGKALNLHAAGLFEKPYNAEELMAVTRLALKEPMATRQSA